MRDVRRIGERGAGYVGSAFLRNPRGSQKPIGGCVPISLSKFIFMGEEDLLAIDKARH